MRRVHVIHFLLAVSASLTAISQSFAGAWTQKKGGIYLKLSANYLYSTKEFNHLGDKLTIFQERIVYKNSSFRDFNITAYFEYGLTDELTLVANVPFKSLQSKRTEIAGGGLVEIDVETLTSGPADLWVSVRQRLFQGPAVASLQGGVKVPLGYDGKPSNDGAPLGTGELDAEINLLLGASLYPLPIYITGGVGYRTRGGPLHDELLYTIEAGYDFGRLLFKVNFDGLRNTERPIPDIVGQPVVTPLPGGGGALPNVIVGDQDITKISPSLIYRVNSRFSLQAEMLSIIAGKNTISGNTFSLGVVFEN